MCACYELRIFSCVWVFRGSDPRRCQSALSIRQPCLIDALAGGLTSSTRLSEGWPTVDRAMTCRVIVTRLPPAVL